MKAIEIILLLLLVKTCLNEDFDFSSDSDFPDSDDPYYSEYPDDNPSDDFSDYYDGPVIPSPQPSSQPSQEPITEPSTLPSPPPSTIEEPKIIPKIVLVAFEKFTMLAQELLFDVIFKNILGDADPKSLLLTVHIKTNNGKLRNLEETVETITCPRDNGDNDTIRFNCAIETELETIPNISVDRNFTLLEGNETSIEEIDSSLSAIASKTIDNIQNQTGSKKYYYLINSNVIKNNNLKFDISGNISENLEEQSVTLNIEKNDDGKIKEVLCSIKDNGNKLECSVDEPINAYLDNVDGKISDDKVLIISMKKNDIIKIKKEENSAKIAVDSLILLLFLLFLN